MIKLLLIHISKVQRSAPNEKEAGRCTFRGLLYNVPYVMRLFEATQLMNSSDTLRYNATTTLP